MKKNNTKTKSPTPATSTAKPTRKKAAPEAAPKVAAAPEPRITPVAAPTNGVHPVKAVVPAPVQTKIVARGDVGFGNALYVRGDGPGLNWNQGVRMECTASDQWELVLGESSRPVAFKVLLNDTTWCSGPDSVVASGSTATVLPEFA